MGLTVEGVTNLLNASIRAMNAIVSKKAMVGDPKLMRDTTIEPELAVVIGIIGEAEGYLLLEGRNDLFNKFADAMYGMHMEDEMLRSFAGEFANMVAGKTASAVFKDGMVIDIKPPDVLSGESHLGKYHTAISVPVQVSELGNMNMVLALKEAVRRFA